MAIRLLSRNQDQSREQAEWTGGPRVKGRLRSRFSYANVVATLALFVVLGGTSYAAIRVSGKNVVDSSLTTKDVKDRSLLKDDFKAGQLPAGPVGGQGASGAQGPNGAQGPSGAGGPAGAVGAQGVQGVAGAPGVSGYQRVISAPFDNPAGAESGGTVSCPAGKKVFGGGVSSGSGKGLYVRSSSPISEAAWGVTMTNASSGDNVFVVFAICGVVR